MGKKKQVSRGCKDVSRGCLKYFKSVSRSFQENVLGVSNKCQGALHSSQLTEQKKGLFSLFETLT